MSTSEFQLEPVGDLSGEVLRFWLLVGIGTTLGWIVHRLLSDPSSRRPQFQHLGSFSRRVSVPIGLAIALAFAVLAHRQSFLPFAAIGWSETTIWVERRYPSRVERLPVDEVSSVAVGHVRGGRCLILETTGGRMIRSTPVSARRAEALRDDLHGFLRSRR